MIVTDQSEEQDRREQIIKAAIQVFAEHGYHKATIKQIAKAAKLKSPALIYWYFKDKDDLAHAVLMRLIPVLQQVADPAALMELPPETVLTMFGRTFFSAFNNPDTPRLMRIFISEALRTPDVIAPLVEGGLMVALKFMRDYLQHQTDLGRLRPHDPDVTARSFVGTLMIYAISTQILPVLGADLPDSDRYLQQIIDVFLDGLRARKDT